MIVLQCIFLIGTAACNYLFANDITFWIVLAHVVIFVVYNIMVFLLTSKLFVLKLKVSSFFDGFIQEQLNHKCREKETRADTEKN